jgi:spermidine/putrescine transport system substrate-binding protein
MKIRYSLIAAAVVALGAASSSMAQEKTLRLLTWADYVPADSQGPVREGIRLHRRGHPVQQRGDDLQAARHRRRRLRPGPAIAGPHHRPAAGVQDLQADGPEQDQGGPVHPLDARRHQEEHHAGRARSTACRTSGAPMAWWSTPSWPRWTTTPTCARPTTRARPLVRLKRPTLLAFAFASGKDPFACTTTQGLHRADGRSGQDRDCLQRQPEVLLGQQGPAATTACAPTRSSAP